MKPTIICRGILLFSLAFYALGSFANEEIIDIDDPLAEKSSADVDLGGVASKPRSEAEAEGDADADEGDEAPTAPDIFEASEQVSEDLSVSFPADI